VVQAKTKKTEDRKFMKHASAQRPLHERLVFRLGLAVLSGILLGFSFPPSPFYSLAYIAFIPIFYLFVRINSYSQITKYSYVFLMVFHLLTVYWTGGFTVGKDIWMMTAGAAVIFIHPLFFIPFILCAFIIRKRIGLIPGLSAFALFWTSFEYLHSLGEYSFPWLTIGNSQAYDVSRIQMIEYTSVYGLSLLVFSFNIIAFIVLWKMANGWWKLRSFLVFGILIFLVMLYFAPVIYGNWIIKKHSVELEKTIRVGVIQPNFDPWEKWGEGSGGKWNSYNFQFDTYLEETKKLANSKPDIIIWPETAIPFHILSPRYERFLYSLQSLVDTLQLPIFTGLPVVEYFNSQKAPATAQKIGTTDIFVESYNSAVMFEPKRRLSKIHKKSILVPFAERIPYAETFRFLIEPLKWNVGISGWGKGEDTLVYSLELRDSTITKYSGMICYESAYPSYVREFVKRGAEFLIVITNDSWWGNTSGAYQHASFASLRAVETRRWIVQCANGGISMLVDPTGTPHMATSLYSKAQFIGEIGLQKNESFYVKYGDIVAQVCLVAAAMMLLAALIQKQKEQ
jgi:apolipoprotein N-acyltransferase